MVKKEVKIKVVFSGSPGSSGVTTVTGRKYGDYISVSFIFDDGDIIHKRRKVRAKTKFEGVEKVLLEETGPYFHEPYENFSDYDTHVTGTTHWQKMYLLLCFGQEHESTTNLGRQFSALSVEQKKDIFGRLESIDDLKTFVEECWDYLWLETDEGTLEDVKSIIRHLEIKTKRNIWKIFKEKVGEEHKKIALDDEEYAEQREVQLTPYKEYAKRASYRVLSNPSIAAAMFNSYMMQGIVDYIEAYYKKHNNYPRGKHTVKRLASGSWLDTNKRFEDETVEFPD
jgi:hypothetical protein